MSINYFFSYLCHNLCEAMKFHKLKILYYLVFVIYLSSINVHQFFHHHEEEHNNNVPGNRLHTHTFDNSQKNDISLRDEFHSADNKYFDENHTLNSLSFLTNNSVIVISFENFEVEYQKSNTSATYPFRMDTKFLRDKYVLSEANLPPPNC